MSWVGCPESQIVHLRKWSTTTLDARFVSLETKGTASAVPFETRETTHLKAEAKSYGKHTDCARSHRICRSRRRVDPDVTHFPVELHLTVRIGFEGNPGANVYAALVAGEMAEGNVFVLRVAAIKVVTVVTHIHRHGKARQLAIETAATGHVTTNVTARLVVKDRIQGQRPHVNIAIRLAYVGQRILRNIGMVEAVFGQHSAAIVEVPTAAQIDAIANVL